MAAKKPTPKALAQVLAKAREVALQKPLLPARPAKSPVKAKLVQALKKLHPMD